MMLWATAVLVLVITASQSSGEVDVGTIDKVVRKCNAQVKAFKKIEYKYIKGPIADILQLTIYSREVKQRPFECITNKLPGVSEEQLLKSSAYQALVRKCKSARRPPKCDPSYKYSRIDGTCNNIDNPEWGSVMCCAQRLFPANYKGASGFRTSVVDGKKLPNARGLSLKLATDVNRPLKSISFLCVAFGQFLAHEITEYAYFSINASDVECCKKPKGLPRHSQCAPMFLKDAFYKKHDVKCLDFNRRAMCDTCRTGKRTSVNVPTSYMDLSLTYGYGNNVIDLRAYDGTGRMSTQYTKKSGELLPLSKNTCHKLKNRQHCFTAGDRRANQHTALMMLHTVFFREHNRICQKLKSMNPHWDDERLFQEARKINIGQFQVIVYKEFLPLIIGGKLMSKYQLDINIPSRYNLQFNPCIWVEFSVEAYRLHTLIPGRVIFHTDGASNSTRFRDTFGNAEPLYRNKTSSYLKQMSKHCSQKYDRHLSVEMTNYLYDSHVGADLAASDIQRGRDNGVPTYAEVIFYRYGKEIKSFDDLHEYMDFDCVRVMREAYADPRDIDLWAGFNCERCYVDTVIAQTPAEIIAEQFQRVKDADRFFFSHDDKYFTPDQQAELKRASLAKIICDNTDEKRMRPESMKIPGSRKSKNKEMPCRLIPGVNLNLWKE